MPDRVIEFLQTNVSHKTKRGWGRGGKMRKGKEGKEEKGKRDRENGKQQQQTKKGAIDTVHENLVVLLFQ